MYLTVISGPMFQGKTTDIINKAERAKALGVKMTIFKPAADNRYTEKPELCTHDDRKFPCVLVNTMDDILQEILKIKDGIFIIDEYFLINGDPIGFMKTLSKIDCMLFIYGLDLDSFGETWPNMDAAHAYANKISKMMNLNDDSILLRYTQKLRETGNKKDVGGKELYDTVTAKEWIPRK